MAKRLVLTKQRRQLILGLHAIGGKMSANGKGLITPDQVKKELHLETPHATQLVYRAHQDGVVATEIVGRARKTLELNYDHPQVRQVLSSTIPGETQKLAEEPQPKRKYQRRAPRLRVPDVGTTLEVSMVFLDRDGHIQLGLRNDEGSWTTSVDGFAAALPE